MSSQGGQLYPISSISRGPSLGSTVKRQKTKDARFSVVSSSNRRRGSEPFAGKTTSTKLKQRATKACDKCREQKCKCVADPHNPRSCTQCGMLGTACTFHGPSLKRGPPKGYLAAVINRLEAMEDTILAKLTGAADDPRARQLLLELIGESTLSQVLSGRIEFGRSRSQGLKKGNGPYGTVWHESCFNDSLWHVPGYGESDNTVSSSVATRDEQQIDILSGVERYFAEIHPQLPVLSKSYYEKLKNRRALGDTLPSLESLELIANAQAIGLHKTNESTPATALFDADESLARKTAWSSCLFLDKILLAMGFSSSIDTRFCDAVAATPDDVRAAQSSELAPYSDQSIVADVRFLLELKQTAARSGCSLSKKAFSSCQKVKSRRAALTALQTITIAVNPWSP
ncbi:hypothetical protein BCV69DRAFT_277493 [Microstroma glucosiphilum]|uniref:Zn(2)-C6 fungal-type domain-containing protein n=1 Tax=Pseudomicrostroma glucosiphilum TaxID=1684307 RepID=A0A316UAW7_9BASI|nr:hypothetical protein BCV69DRAFT_277493 [Pseudomicrostroma glucosiphilum]PWN20185.1 hypothetical protein BCV69DRAFT_277493 [Pseudomicrostroma glucosiphilum]